MSGTPSGHTAAPIGERAWMITFADLISLLLTFAVLLFADSDADRAAWREAAASLARHVGVAAVLPDPPPALQPPPRAHRLLDLDYLEMVLTPTLAAEPAFAAARLTRTDGRLALSLPAPILSGQGGGPSEDGAGKDGRREEGPGADEARALAVLARVLAGFANRTIVEARAAAAAAPADGWERALARACSLASALRRAGLDRPVGCSALAEPGSDAIGDDPTAWADALQPRIDLVVFASGGG